MSATSPFALTADQLYRHSDPALFPFETTAALPDLAEVIAQPRAVEAVRFGIGMRAPGYNLFAMGPSGIGKATTIRQFLVREAAKQPVPDDWCYVYNFADPRRPRALRLPPGAGRTLRKDVQALIAELRRAIPAAFESEEYEARKQRIAQKLREKQEAMLAQLRQAAEARGLAMIKTAEAIGFAPVAKGQILSPEQFQALPADKREQIERDIAALNEQLEDVAHDLGQGERMVAEETRQLDRQVAAAAADPHIQELAEKYALQEGVVAHLQAMQGDILDNLAAFLPAEQDGQDALTSGLVPGATRESLFQRYDVNVIVDRTSEAGAPIVVVDNPTHQNLIGTVEHRAEMGALVTDFTLIKAGALHQANGGYLILEAATLLQKPFAWEGLKRALRTGRIAIEAMAQDYSPVSTVSLEPEPIPLQTKVVLLGEPALYYLLYENDPDFAELFKVQVDFAEDMPRTLENENLYACFVATLARQEGLRPFTREGVARVVEHAARLSEDQGKLSVRFRPVADLLQEADFWAGQRGAAAIEAADVQRAIDASTRRADQVRELVQEEIASGTIMIDVQGAQVGQVNGLSVSQLGSFSFGRPSRITARTRLGSGKVVDIEREVALGGPLHSKGVLILSSFLGARYIPDEPLSLSASLVFEQSYTGIDGDSASSAELYALLSDLAGIPIKQSLAVTGSVNQNGEVQAIGGVNEKIEGFFDVCRLMPGGLTGQQGVVIPRANVRHLMLRHDVVEAVREGRFHIYAVSTIDEGIEVLTGVPAGARGADGAFPEGTVNRRVEDRLRLFAERSRSESGSAKDRKA